MDIKKSFNKTIEDGPQKSELSFTSIEVQLARLGMQPQLPIVQSLEPRPIEHQAVPLLEQGATAIRHPAPPVPTSSSYIYNVTQSPLSQQYQRYHPEMVAGTAPPSAKCRGDVKNLHGWILQIDDYFTMTQICNE